MLKMEHIRKVFPGVVALDDVHFQLDRGEVHVLLGENGAGKSTLIKLLSGAYQKTAGRIVLEDREIAISNPRHALTLGIATIYQELNLIPHLTVAENIFLGRERLLMPGIIDHKKTNAAAQEMIDRLGVAIDAAAPLASLGIAQKQMVEVAKALSVDSKILIMDEPTSALTDREINELFKIIRRLKQKGVSVIYISHNLDELFEIGDRVTVMRDGRTIGTYAVADTSKEALIRLMVNRDLKEQYPRKKIQKGDEVLRVENINTKALLKNVSFSLHQGEILGITGLMGSGRTELARVLFGLDPCQSGQITVKGKTGCMRSPRAAIKRGIGFLTEDRKSQGLVLKLSVRENICLSSVERFSRMGIVGRRQENRAADKYIKELQIKTPGAGQKVVFLSGGNQQKVVMSKWLCSHADILIFDEPTRGIDVGSKVEIYEWMNRLTEAGAAILMMSSELLEILGMSDRILVMSRGKIAGEFTPEQATQEKMMQCALGV